MSDLHVQPDNRKPASHEELASISDGTRAVDAPWFILEMDKPGGHRKRFFMKLQMLS